MVLAVWLLFSHRIAPETLVPPYRTNTIYMYLSGIVPSGNFRVQRRTSPRGIRPVRQMISHIMQARTRHPCRRPTRFLESRGDVFRGTAVFTPNTSLRGNDRDKDRKPSTVASMAATRHSTYL